MGGSLHVSDRNVFKEYFVCFSYQYQKVMSSLKSSVGVVGEAQMREGSIMKDSMLLLEDPLLLIKDHWTQIKEVQQ